MFFPGKVLFPSRKEKISLLTVLAVSVWFFFNCADKQDNKALQDCSYQGEALNVPTAFEGLWSSSNNIKTLYEIK